MLTAVTLNIALALGLPFTSGQTMAQADTTPEHSWTVAEVEESHTGRYLKPMLEARKVAAE